MLTFFRASGLLESLKYQGVEYLARGPQVELWRGATDNDGLKLRSGQREKALGRWRLLGLDKLQRRNERFTWKQNGDGSLTVRLRHAASGRGKWADCRHDHSYTLYSDGRLLVDNMFSFGAQDMTDLPRVGVSLHLKPEFSALQYLGRGPIENYSDRRSSALVGRYQATVENEYVPYIMPQEHGHHTDTRWVEFTSSTKSKKGRGASTVRIIGETPFDFNATHFTAEDLYAAKHTIDLIPRKETIVYLDSAHRGLGTASCGPDTLRQYRLEKRRYALRYEIQLA
jgi:beta-galactosidase